jgi:high-affinity Fe2+/Pb2+ permease
MTIAGAMAGAQNTSFPIIDGMIFGACVAGGLCWTIVLITNRK